jgi:hypothetical protein
VPIAIDATVGAASANSYSTLADADAYFVSRLGGGAWRDVVDDEIRKAALITATSRLDEEIYRGKRATSTQALAWPRVNVYATGVPLPTDAIPMFVKKAMWEQALDLLVKAGQVNASTDPLGPTGLEPFKSLGVGDIKLDLRDPAATQGNARLADDPSVTLAAEAYRQLRAYIITDLNAQQVGMRTFPITRGG